MVCFRFSSTYNSTAAFVSNNTSQAGTSPSWCKLFLECPLKCAHTSIHSKTWLTVDVMLRCYGVFIIVTIASTKNLVKSLIKYIGLCTASLPSKAWRKILGSAWNNVDIYLYLSTEQLCKINATEALYGLPNCMSWILSFVEFYDDVFPIITYNHDGNDFTAEHISTGWWPLQVP